MKKKSLKMSLFVGIALLATGTFCVTSCGETRVSESATVLLSASKAAIKVGEVKTLSVSVSKGYAGSVRWFTSNETVAAVNANGYVFGIGPGTAIITASYGGGYADCEVTVTASGGGEVTDYLMLTPSNKSIKVGDTFTITHNVSPADSTVTYSVTTPGIVSFTNITGGVSVRAEAVGTTQIKAQGSNNLISFCNIEVIPDSGETEDIGIPSNLGYGGTISVGSPLAQKEWMSSMLSEFNRLTGSNVTWDIRTFEESDGPAKFPNAEAMPYVFPYASDQTLGFYQFGALTSLGTDDKNWLVKEVGQTAHDAAKLGSKVVGYPFAADNGFAMFYNTDFISEDIAYNLTVDKLYEIAGANMLEVDYALTNAFYGLGALQSYNGGVSSYTMTPSAQSYSSTSDFNNANCIKAAKAINKMALNPWTRYSASLPTTSRYVLATITTVSVAKAYKDELGAKYAVAPLPFIEEGQPERLGSYLGYKFYGVNGSISNAEDKVRAGNVAKFLCSNYVQKKRFESFCVRPTNLKLQDETKNEPHIRALDIQEACHSSIPLVATGSELWSEGAVALTAITKLPAGSSDAAFASILRTLDKACTL